MANSPLLASNYGAHTVHVAAPGVSILSTYVKKTEKKKFVSKMRSFVSSSGHKIDDEHKQYECLHGTSMAAPHVVGSLAAIIDQFPDFIYEDLANIDPMTERPYRKLMYRKVINRLLKTADKIESVPGIPERKVRYGKINLRRALTSDREYGVHNADKFNEITSMLAKGKEKEHTDLLWTPVVQKAQRAHDFFLKAAEAFSGSKDAFIPLKEYEGDSWDKALDSSFSAAEQLVNAIDERSQGVKTKLKTVAEVFSMASDFFRSAAKKYAEGNRDDGIQQDNLAADKLQIAEQLALAIKKVNRSRVSDAVTWSRIIDQDLAVVTLYHQIEAADEQQVASEMDDVR